MSESFDPYRKWLGISPTDQPPNHYRLLGVDLFETDLDVIDAAANKQMGYVQQKATGQYAALSQKLLNEMSAARLCLLDPKKKSAYDAELGAKQISPLAPLPSSDDPLSEALHESMPRTKRTTEAPSEKNPWIMVGAGGVAALLLVVGGVLFLFSGNSEKLQETALATLPKEQSPPPTSVPPSSTELKGTAPALPTVITPPPPPLPSDSTAQPTPKLEAVHKTPPEDIAEKNRSIEWEPNDSGAFAFSEQRSSLLVKGNPHTSLRSKDRFTNFVISLEYRIPVGGLATTKQGSGVRVRTVGDGYYEAQIGNGSTGDFWISVGRTLETTVKDSRFPLMRPRYRNAEKKPGDWNHYKIRCERDEITLTLNGEVVNKGKQAVAVAGHVEILSQGTEVEFRNIVLKPVSEETVEDSKKVLLANGNEIWVMDNRATAISYSFDRSEWKPLDNQIRTQAFRRGKIPELRNLEKGTTHIFVKYESEGGGQSSVYRVATSLASAPPKGLGDPVAVPSIPEVKVPSIPVVKVPSAFVNPPVSDPLAKVREKLRGTKWANDREASFEWTMDGRFLHRGIEREWRVLDTQKVEITFAPNHIDKLIFDQAFTAFTQLARGGPTSLKGRRLSPKP